MDTHDFRELAGRPVAAAIMADCRERAARLAEGGHQPKLAVLRVGERPDDVYYEGSIRRHCEQAGILCQTRHFAADVRQEELAASLREAAADPAVDGLFFFSPLPAHLDEDALRRLIPPAKDVDALAPASAAAVFAGGEGFAPCTPAAVMELLRFYQIPLSGRRALVLGRSQVVGKPLAMLLLAADATVTVAHSRTRELPQLCREAEIVLAAVGRPRLVAAEWLAAGQVVVDVGINADPEAPGRMCGDVDSQAAREIVAALAPSPGGIGLVTTAILCRHTIEAAENKAAENKI